MTVSDVAGKLAETGKLKHLAVVIYRVTAGTCTAVITDSGRSGRAGLDNDETVVINLKLFKTVVEKPFFHLIVLELMINSCKSHQCKINIMQRNVRFLEKILYSCPDYVCRLVKAAFHILMVASGTFYHSNNVFLLIKKCISGLGSAAVNTDIITHV